MGDVIKVFLLLVIGLVALVVLGLLFLRWKLLKALGGLAEGLEELGQGMNPAEIHLAAEPEPEWSEPQTVARQIEALQAAGHEPIGAYTVDAMPGLTIEALVNPGESSWSVVYDYPGMGVWVDVVTRYADGGGLTATNSPHVDKLDPMPGKDRAIEVGADVPRIVELWAEAVRPDGRKPAVAESFVAEFEQAYAEEMAWRDKRGGPTEEEVRRIAVEMNDEVSEDAIQATVDVQAAQAALREAERAAKTEPWEV